MFLAEKLHSVIVRSGTEADSVSLIQHLGNVNSILYYSTILGVCDKRLWAPQSALMEHVPSKTETERARSIGKGIVTLSQKIGTVRAVPPKARVPKRQQCAGDAGRVVEVFLSDSSAHQ